MVESLTLTVESLIVTFTGESESLTIDSLTVESLTGMSQSLTVESLTVESLTVESLTVESLRSNRLRCYADRISDHVLLGHRTTRLWPFALAAVGEHFFVSLCLLAT